MIDQEKWKNMDSNRSILVNSKHPLDFYIGVNPSGKYTFKLRCKAKLPNLKSLPSPAGIELNILTEPQNKISLLLSLVSSEDFQLFKAFCNFLMAETEELNRVDDDMNFKIVLQKVKRWQELFKNKKPKRLSDSEILGLVGELSFLKDVALTKLPAKDAILSWRGPYGDEQDFLFTGKIIEVKTQLSTSDQYIHINSEAQLDTSSGQICLAHQTLDVSQKTDVSAFSLNTLVREINDIITKESSQAVDSFHIALLENSYEELEYYNQNYFTLNKRSFFEVRENFPRIVNNMLLSGVQNVRYRIQLGACKHYLLSGDEALNWMFDE